MRMLQAKHDIPKLLELMDQDRELFVPVRDEGGGRFARWSDLDLSVNEDIENTLMLAGEATRRPAKDQLFAETATLFRFRLEQGDFHLEEPPPGPSPRVLFGVRPCDGRGFQVIDTLLVGPHGGDTAYQQAREANLLVGVGCKTPGPDCFCTSVGGDPHSSDGLDVLLTDLGDAFLLESITEPGRDWLSGLQKHGVGFLHDAGKRDAERARVAQHEARQRVPRQVDTSRLPKILERSFNSDVWATVAPACIGCGACTFLCPTCRCFDIQDLVQGSRGARVRVWDSCMFREYTQEASGHNPRIRRAQRWRNRFYDKFHWSGDGRGNPACVGCGRCITHCPSGIDLVEMIERVTSAEGGA
ncbi:MAG: 4Fe-4S dicluster domain-containing protein [Gammaproteobacteria bacterium]|nr:4Fe-4S dicluster domain-containing protein [Gammaproteobacteria bacterium]